MDVPFFAFVSHDKTRFEAHVRKRLIEVPRHAETCAAPHPRINVVLVAVVEFTSTGGATRLFEANDFRQILVGDVRNLVAEINHLFHVFGRHCTGFRF